MRIVKLDATDSTNSYLRRLYTQETLSDFTAVVAHVQTQGRGQMGTIWESQPSKNLTFSVYKRLVGVRPNDSFYISMSAALALMKTLELFSIPRLSVKWPNDIMSANKKICGILIENVMKQGVFESSIIGIGLNVNQTDFEKLPQASSLKSILGIDYDMDQITVSIIQNLKVTFERLERNELKSLKEEYESYLFRKNKPSTFKDAEGSMFSGFIKGVSKSGKLQVLLEDQVVQHYDLKEITLLY
ncbi:biotin--[acetyl-CoA-carboxylase] ligase [Algibacter mikhailovii]|uniref:biotin--[acetyl-CoA-carboxylase] ligase n=1 Tax=Algibacter mikhailovii TaxID=425498 RepID=UPI0024956BE1|nr:biotin--[acetyl-CoA-carboxylase] ligase [Algibacter mikhailovii]